MCSTWRRSLHRTPGSLHTHAHTRAPKPQATILHPSSPSQTSHTSQNVRVINNSVRPPTLACLPQHSLVSSQTTRSPFPKTIYSIYNIYDPMRAADSESANRRRCCMCYTSDFSIDVTLGCLSVRLSGVQHTFQFRSPE